MQEVSSGFDISQCLSTMSLEPRETGLLNIMPMKWYSSQCPVGQQFKHIYSSRLDQMTHNFGQIKERKIDPISQISEDNQTYCVRGIVKRLEVERVRAFEKGFESKYAGQKAIYSAKDELEIEDKTGKIKLHISRETIGNFMRKQVTQQDLPYGVCLIVLGIFKKRINKFIAKQLYFPQVKMPRQPPKDISNKKVLVVSQPSQELCYHIRDIVLNGISASLGITALIMIGGLKMTVEQIKWIASFVSDIKEKIDIFLQPSSGEERNRLFPLRPYNKLFFLKQHEDVGLCSNPQLFNAKNGLQMHVSCGQNVKDLIKNSALVKNELDALEMMLRFRHYCPTSPFSLKTEPFLQDYLVVEDVPNVMVTGKALDFDFRTVQVEQGKVLLVSIPANTMALVDLDGSSAKIMT